jgi:predicted nucleic acid-binding protein
VTSGAVILDTSIVIRLQMGEPTDQFEVATRFLKDHSTAGISVHVDDLVLAEAYFALQSYYQLPKADALLALALFARHSGVLVSPVATAVLAQSKLATAKPGFVDRLIHGSSHTAGRTLVTFETAARKLPATLVLQP